MLQLPQKQFLFGSVGEVMWLRRMLVGVVTGTTYWGLKTTDVADTHVAVAGYATVDDDFSDDEYADYTMLDNDDIYSFLANN